MMRKLIILLPFLLTGCLEDKLETAGSKSHCYDIVPIHSGPPNSPLLINHCTGETWMILRTVLSEDPKRPHFKYGWHRIEVWNDENDVANQF